MSSRTIVDSLPLPDYGQNPNTLQSRPLGGGYRSEEVPFSPQEVWSLGWDGALITGHSSEYRFEIRYRDGRRTVIERETEPDRSGKLWVLREGEGRPLEGWAPSDDWGWREWERNPAWIPERWFDVFEESTGRYLGRVEVPPGFLIEPEPVIDGEIFICLTEDAFGRPIVRRYRLELS